MENKLYPFLCVYGDEDEQTLISAVAHVYNSGARGLCVESKHSPHYGKEHWWFTLDTVLRESKKYGMKMWTVDEPFVPSGYAGGAVKSHPDLRKKHLVETHIDVIGPICGAKILTNPTSEEDLLLGAAAYRRADGETEDLTGEPIDLTANIHGDILYWNVPDGVYRVFFIYVTQHYAGDYVDFFNRNSVQLILDEIYEPHYRRYREEFGKTFAGFFSDEPGFWNPPFGEHKGAAEDFCNAVGVAGYAMPWGENVWARMGIALGRKQVGDLVALWYNTGESPCIRFAYMDAVTQLFYENFNKTIGDWCRERGVVYNGHVVEDNGVHARFGMGAGHYFRAMKAYEFAGVDIVLHQVLPGFAHCRHASFADGGFANTDFYHYVLGQLAASDAHLNKKSGKALCEIFGAFGWGENVSMMKWLIDFMLVRGVTRFIPHSFTTHTHDPVFPPTFSAKNCDPQFDGVKLLFEYIQQAGELLEGGTHVAPAAILYTGFAEWLTPNSGKALETTARVLYDGHICYDILPEDNLLQGVTVKNGNIVCGEQTYRVLVVPNVPKLPECLLNRLNELSREGGKILYVNGLPNGCGSGEVVVQSKLAEHLTACGAYDVQICGNEFLRYYHCKKGNRHIYLFFNESINQSADACVRLSHTGRYLRLNLLRQGNDCGETKDGLLNVRLSPYESVIYVFDDFSEREFQSCRREQTEGDVLFPQFKWDIFLAPYDDSENFVFYASTDELFDIANFDRKPCFSGAIRYVTRWRSERVGAYKLRLGEVGGVASVKANGVDCGTAICAPYEFSVDGTEGENELEITVRTPLAGAMLQKENFGGFSRRLTAQIPLSFTGLKGPVSLTEIDDGEKI